MTDFKESFSISDLTTVWSDNFTRMVNKGIVERLFRKKVFRNPKKYHSCLKHYLSKTLHKNRI